MTVIRLCCFAIPLTGFVLGKPSIRGFSLPPTSRHARGGNLPEISPVATGLVAPKIPMERLQVIPSKMVVPGSVVFKWDDLKDPLKCLGAMEGTYHQFLFTTSWNKPEIMQSDVMVGRRWELHLPPKKEQKQIRKIFQDFTQVDVS